MTWFDQKICTLVEAQQKAGEVPGFLQLGDLAKLWLDTPEGYTPIECYVVGKKVGFQSKFFYDLAVPLGDSGFCVVLSNIYGWVTPPQVTQFDPKRYAAADITAEVPALRREGMQLVQPSPIPGEQLLTQWGQRLLREHLKLVD